MLTARGWWFLTLVLAVGAIGGVMAVRGSPALLIACLALALWFIGEWAGFYYQARLIAPQLSVERRIGERSGPARLLWAGQTYPVELIVRSVGRLSYVELNDRPPIGAETEQSPTWTGSLSAANPANWRYDLRCHRSGVARFDGVRVRMADMHGFFYAEWFIRDSTELPVLPGVAGSGPHKRADKRFNMLPPPGVHRLRRPGTGSELLELREYQPGDPPKRIAWKISAKREQLITREYESEVPVRCTLLIDATNPTRVGPPGATALAGLCTIAATVAEAAIRNRDLVGLTVTDEITAEVMKPARTSTHFVTILERLSRTAPAQPICASREVVPLLARADALAQELYPELMNHGRNRFPLWLPWLCPTPVGGRFGWLRKYRYVLSANYRRQYAMRKRLAALIAARYALGVGATSLLMEDDAACSIWLQRLLADHRVPFQVRLPRAPEPLLQARALLRAVSRGRDNELYILMGEYLDRGMPLDQLLRAVRVARSRHHQVMVVQPGKPPAPPSLHVPATDIEAIVDYARQCRAWRRWQTLRRKFGKLGVPVIAAGSGDPARLILHRLEQLRAAQGAARR